MDLSISKSILTTDLIVSVTLSVKGVSMFLSAMILKRSEQATAVFRRRRSEKDARLILTERVFGFFSVVSSGESGFIAVWILSEDDVFLSIENPPSMHRFYAGRKRVIMKIPD